MNTNAKQNTTSTKPTHRTIDRAVASLAADMDVINAVRTDTMDGRIARLVMIYEGLAPLLRVLTTVSLLPTNWRAAVALFNDALAAVVAGLGETAATFKAGKDLEA
jgi:hypothetical protein